MRKVLRNKAKPILLTEIERRGRPEDIAAETIRLSADYQKRAVGVPRASSLYSACIRQLVLAKGQEDTERISLAERITFGIGDAVHHWAQNTPFLFGDNRVGWWRCMNCGKIRTFGRPPVKPCRHCGAPHTAAIYHEHSAVAPDPYQGTGHPDLFIRKSKMLRLVELKTIAADGFTALTSPKIEHVWQLQFYMWACSQDSRLPKQPDGRVGYICYLSKGHLRQSLPCKMFILERDDNIIKEIQAKLAAYQDAFSKDVLPECESECVRKEFACYRARDCGVMERCRTLQEAE
jgi:hypothetical protein